MHQGPLPLPSQLAEYDAVHPGAARWIIEQADKGAAHVREMELRAIKTQRLDMLLHRGLPFALVALFLIASVALAFVYPIGGALGLITTVATVLIAYLTGRAPPDQPPP
jgi:uncharacterized membrane protein